MANVARRLSAMAAEYPELAAVVAPLGHNADGVRNYRTVTFAELDKDSTRIAAGLVKLGVKPGTRIALLVRPGIEFVTLVFALFKAGAVSILIDPGMGRGNLAACLAAAEPEGFVAIPAGHVVRHALWWRFRRAKINVVVGRAFLSGAHSLDAVRAMGDADFTPVQSKADEPAAIIFTTGSTGPPKGVLYEHGNFDQQVAELQAFYQIQPGELDLAGFPLFGLFNGAMGVTTIVPDMDPTRPARVNPRNIIEAVLDWQVTQSFGSPAMWNRVGQYCEEQFIGLPSLRRVLSAGAPVPPHVLARMQAAIHPDGSVHTPYGATEALPVASIEAREILGETSLRTREGAGVCVGRHFPSLRWRIIRIVDGPIAAMADAELLPTSQIGELVVTGPVVTKRYVTRTEANLTGKITETVDGDTVVWHRMGDVGYLDDQDRFWFCGRMAHRVLSASGPMYTVCCEAIFNLHPLVYRSALVGIGLPGRQRPVIIVEALAWETAALATSEGTPRSRAAGFGQGEPADRIDSRLPGASRHASRYSAQRQDLSREAGRVGSQAAEGLNRAAPESFPG